MHRIAVLTEQETREGRRWKNRLPDSAPGKKGRFPRIEPTEIQEKFLTLC